MSNHSEKEGHSQTLKMSTSSSSGELVLQAAIAALFAGALVVALTISIERVGALGGVIATVPSTVCVVAVSFAVQGADTVVGLFYVPVGMLASVMFLVSWRTLPVLLARCRCACAGRRLLVAMLLLSIVIWLLVASLLELSVRALVDVGLPVRVAGVFFVLLQLAIGLYLAVFKPLPDVKAKVKPNWKTFLVRGIVAGTVVFISDLLASFEPEIGGVLSTFPAMFATSTFALSWTHGVELSRGAIAPMALGSVSVGVFACLFAEIFTLIVADIPNVAGAISLALPTTWIITVCVTSLPIFALLRRLKRKRQATPIEADAQDDEVGDAELDAKLAAHSALLQGTLGGGGDDDDDLSALDNDAAAAGLLARKIEADS